MTPLVTSRQPATPPSDVWPLPIPDGTGATAIPPRLRELLLGYPRVGVRVIHRTSVTDPFLRNVLRAELFLRLGQRRRAVTHAQKAMAAAGSEQPIIEGRLLLAMTVLVDLRCCTGDPFTAGDCLGLSDLAHELGDQRRAVLAEALLCIAVFQHTDCRHGRRLLGELHQRYLRDHGDTALAVMLAGGLTGMQHACKRASLPYRPGERLPVMPGGLLTPSLDHPPAGYLVSRVGIHPGRHTCDLTAAPIGSGQAIS